MIIMIIAILCHKIEILLLKYSSLPSNTPWSLSSIKSWHMSLEPNLTVNNVYKIHNGLIYTKLKRMKKSYFLMVIFLTFSLFPWNDPLSSTWKLLFSATGFPFDVCVVKTIGHVFILCVFILMYMSICIYLHGTICLFLYVHSTPHFRWQHWCCW